MARIEDLMATELGKADELMSEAVQHLFQAGGKRFRPLFTVLAAQLGPDPTSWQVDVAGAVIELVHLATLYHDDVMDEAQVRRGAPSANARWSNNIAIPAGDYLFATASRLVSRLGPEAVRVLPTRSPSWSRARCARPAARPTTSTPSSTTSRWCTRRPLPDRGVRPVRSDVLRRRRGADRAAEPARGIVGTAFQISDDIIDIDSDPDESESFARHGSARGRAHAPCCTRCGKPAPTPTGCVCCWPARSRMTTTWRRRCAVAGLAGHGAGQRPSPSMPRRPARSWRTCRGSGPPGTGDAGGLHGQPSRLRTRSGTCAGSEAF